MATIDYYSTLGVAKDASIEEIKTAYKKLAKKYHPDVNSEPGSQDNFKEVSRAYQILSDPQKRQAYDQMGHANFEQARQQGFSNNYQSGFSGYGVNFEDIFSGFRDPFDIFSELFGSAGFQSQARRRTSVGEDLQIIVNLSFEEAVFGTEKEISYRAYAQCPHCAGTGSSDKDSGLSQCSQCQGKGQVRAQTSFLGAQFSQITPCPTCQGKGQVVTNPCSHCQGNGRRETTIQTKLKVPPGVDTGNRMQVPGKGNTGPNNTPSGDLYVVFKVAAHKIFQRQGSDLLLDIPITIPQAVLGDTIEIPVLGGAKKSVKIPAGTNHQQKIKLRNLGIQKLNSSSRGDLLLNIQLQIPKKLTREEKQLYAQLQDIDAKSPSFLDKLFR